MTESGIEAPISIAAAKATGRVAKPDGQLADAEENGA